MTHGKLFLAIYGVLATYFSCVMIRLMLTLAPVVCIIAAIAISELFKKAGASIRHHIIELDKPDPIAAAEVADKNADSKQPDKDFEQIS